MTSLPGQSGTQEKNSWLKLLFLFSLHTKIILIIFADWKKVAWLLRVNTKHKLMQISVRSKIQV